MIIFRWLEPLFKGFMKSFKKRKSDNTPCLIFRFFGMFFGSNIIEFLLNKQKLPHLKHAQQHGRLPSAHCWSIYWYQVVHKLCTSWYQFIDQHQSASSCWNVSVTRLTGKMLILLNRSWQMTTEENNISDTVYVLTKF